MVCLLPRILLRPTVAQSLLALIHIFTPSTDLKGGARLSFTPRVERGPSEAARCASKKDI